MTEKGWEARACAIHGVSFVFASLEIIEIEGVGGFLSTKNPVSLIGEMHVGEEGWVLLDLDGRG